MGNLTGRAAALVETVHAHPGVTRTEAARTLGLGSGAVTELVARLSAAGLLAEERAAPSGARGRPTSVLGAHPEGPLVVAAAIAQESWRVVVAELGGAVLAAVSESHAAAEGPQVLADVGATVRRFRRRFGARMRGIGISVPGTVRHGSVLDAANLGWRGLDLRAVWPRAEHFVADNDATLAALAESRRGAAVGAAVALHIRVEAGLGGAVLDHGRLLAGAHGVAGEFGHMPFGDPSVPCPCGARGCWGTSVDGTALARALHAGAPRDPVTYARRVLERARAGGAAEMRAARLCASAFGRGLGGLVNGLDPDLVTVGGLGADLLTTAPSALQAAYTAGLMEFRRSTPPPVVAATLGADGSLVGAAEEVWTQVWPALSY